MGSSCSCFTGTTRQAYFFAKLEVQPNPLKLERRVHPETKDVFLSGHLLLENVGEYHVDYVLRTADLRQKKCFEIMPSNNGTINPKSEKSLTVEARFDRSFGMQNEEVVLVLTCIAHRKVGKDRKKVGTQMIEIPCKLEQILQEDALSPPTKMESLQNEGESFTVRKLRPSIRDSSFANPSSETIESYQWVDEISFVELFISSSGVHRIPRNQIHVDTQIQSFRLIVDEEDEGNNFYRRKLNLPCLFDQINVEESTIHISDDKIVAKLVKKKARPWPKLTQSHEDVAKAALAVVKSKNQKYVPDVLSSAASNVKNIDPISNEQYGSKKSLMSKSAGVSEEYEFGTFSTTMTNCEKIFNEIRSDIRLKQPKVSATDQQWSQYSEIVQHPVYMEQPKDIFAKDGTLCTTAISDSASNKIFTSVALVIAKQNPNAIKSLFRSSKVLENKQLYLIQLFGLHSKRKPIATIVDDSFPQDFAFARCSDTSEMWLSLLEKASAFVRGSYSLLGKSSIIEVMRELLGLHIKELHLTKIFRKEVTGLQRKKNLFYAIKGLLTEARILICVFANQNDCPCGIMDICEDTDGAEFDFKVCIFNPWLRRTNTWRSNESSKWIRAAEFLQNSECLVYSHDIGQPISVLERVGEWRGDVAGGSFEFSSWRNNPQFLLKCERRSHVFITLSQSCVSGKEDKISLSIIRGCKPKSLSAIVLPHPLERTKLGAPNTLQGKFDCGCLENDVDFELLEMLTPSQSENVSVSESNRSYQFERRKFLTREIFVDPTEGPLILIPMKETPRKEGAFTLTIALHSSFSDNLKCRLSKGDELLSNVNMNHDRFQPTSVALLALPRGGGWHVLCKKVLVTWNGTLSHSEDMSSKDPWRARQKVVPDGRAGV
eukprot:g4058.t1